MHTVPQKKYTQKNPPKLSVQKNTGFGIPYTDFLWLQLDSGIMPELNELNRPKQEKS
jgi:hypothetical protein